MLFPLCNNASVPIILFPLCKTAIITLQFARLHSAYSTLQHCKHHFPVYIYIPLCNNAKPSLCSSTLHFVFLILNLHFARLHIPLCKTASITSAKALQRAGLSSRPFNHLQQFASQPKWTTAIHSNMFY